MWGFFGDYKRGLVEFGELIKGLGILSGCVKFEKVLSVLLGFVDTSPKAQYDNLCRHCKNLR